ncbi:MAG: hypothetical protein CM15mP89_4560 [Gammaproteobacteria bacterium]|nr:MAG: hypothetical protein CM15mP89_4560 [Gammaproteobacteria bacterium]
MHCPSKTPALTDQLLLTNDPNESACMLANR